MSQPSFVWFNGALVEYESVKATVDLPQVDGVFERLRTYPCAEVLKENTLLCKFDDSLENIYKSAKVFNLALEKRVSKDNLREAVLETIRANEFRTYVDVVVSVWPSQPEAPNVSIVAKQFESILGSDDFENPKKFTLVSAKAPSSNLFTEARAWASYLEDAQSNSDAKAKGFYGCLFIDSKGYVFAGYNNFLAVVKNGAVTVQLPRIALKDVVRSSIVTIAKDLGYSVAEREIAKADLLDADEAFICGVESEVTPVTEVDGVAIGEGKVGEVTAKIAKRFADGTQAKTDKYLDWLTTVYAE
jgi:branched-chain amino acid aminotransferase